MIYIYMTQPTTHVYRYIDLNIINVHDLWSFLFSLQSNNPHYTNLIEKLSSSPWWKSYDTLISIKRNKTKKQEFPFKESCCFHQNKLLVSDRKKRERKWWFLISFNWPSFVLFSFHHYHHYKHHYWLSPSSGGSIQIQKKKNFLKKNFIHPFSNINVYEWP